LRDENFLVGIRISADEHCPGGLDLADTKRIINTLVDEGLDYVNLSSGRAESYKWFLPGKDGFLMDESAEIKRDCGVPVMCPNIHRPSTAEKVIAEEKADIALIGRGLLADPEWALKAREGRGKDIVHCIFCNTCLGLFAQDESIRCVQNPNLGRERFMPEYWSLPVPQQKIFG
jgi:2,4-dienoyl-CoA reductase-like NADH-dependent reductase (Old Yellow Enzyme family)